MNISYDTFRYLQLILYTITLSSIIIATRKRTDLKPWALAFSLLYISILFDQLYRELSKSNFQNLDWIYFLSMIFSITAIVLLKFGLSNQFKKIIKNKPQKNSRNSALKISISISVCSILILFITFPKDASSSQWSLFIGYILILTFFYDAFIKSLYIYLLDDKKATNLFLSFTLGGSGIALIARFMELYGIDDISYMLMFSDMVYIMMIFSTSIMTIFEEKLEDERNNKKILEEVIWKNRNFQAVGTLAGGIAHDFNNFLSIIFGHISLMEETCKKKDFSDLLEDIQDIKFSLEQAKHLTHQLLIFSKGQVLDKKITDIREIIKETSQFAAQGKNITLEFEFSENLWNVIIDKNQISRVFNNLVLNAVQAVNEGGAIRIKCLNHEIQGFNKFDLPNGQYLKVSVEDNGIGIAKENLPFIFDLYYSTKESGSGIGLAISYSIIKQHNGNIIVESEKGIGTSFTFLIPAIKTSDLKSAKNISNHENKEKETLSLDFKSKEKFETEKGQKIQRKTILILEDNENLAKTLINLLELLNCNSIITKSGQETIEIFKKYYFEKRQFDLVILDLTIKGGMGGKETIKELRKIDNNVKALLSSGYYEGDIYLNYKQYGFQGVLAKPYTLQELEAKIKENI